MGMWKWEGVTREGQKVRGSDEAKNEREIRQKLRIKGVRTTKLTAPNPLEIDLNAWLLEKGIGTPFGAQELLTFTKQLSVMIQAGVPIMQTLEILYTQQKNLAMKAIIKKVSNDVGGGKTLSEALRPHKGFDTLYCNLIAAGESGGVLDSILEKITEFLEKREKIKSQIKSAMIYPTAVVVVGVAVVYGMLYFVVPKFVEMLQESGQEIPAITQFVMDASAFLQEYTPIIAPIIFILIALFNAWRKSTFGKPIWDRVMMHFPVFGTIVVKGNLCSFARTLSTMLVSGVSLIDSLEICSTTLDNAVVAKDALMVKSGVEQGRTLTEPLSKIKYFPDMVIQMVKIGEQTGNLDKMLEKVADLFEREVEDAIAAATKLMEPIILVVLGGCVAVILVAMYMPIFKSAGGA